METHSYKDNTRNNPIEPKLFKLNIIFHSLLDEYEWTTHNNGQKYPLTFYENKRDLKYIVLHYTVSKSSKEGESTKMSKWWNQAWNKKENYDASADFGVDDMSITQFNPDLEYYSCHATSDNCDKISIEMCNMYDDMGTIQKFTEIHANAPQWYFSEEVLKNTKKLIIELFQKYGKMEIITHYDVPSKNGNRKRCPGIYGWNNAMKFDKDGNPCGYNDTSELEKFKQEIEELWEATKKVM